MARVSVCPCTWYSYKDCIEHIVRNIKDVGAKIRDLFHYDVTYMSNMPT